MYRVVIALLIVCCPHAIAADAEHIMRVDVVGLVNGQELEGDPSISIDRGKFTYFFATEQHRVAFEANPAQYEVQLGGACGSMGPLSGEGRTDLYTVYGGHVYLFASEGCRTRFLRTPERFIDRDDPVPWVTTGSAEAGRRLLGQAVEAIGGREALDELASIRMTREWETEEYSRVLRWTFVFPATIEKWAAWDDFNYSVAAGPDHGYFTYNDGSIHPLEPAQRAVLLRTMHQQPVTILAQLDRPGTVISRLGEETVTMPDESTVIVDLVAVAHSGVTTTIGVDRESGRPVMARYRGRGAGAFVGDIVHFYDEFEPVSDLVLPHRVTTTFDGRPYAEESGRYTSIEVNRDAHRDVLVSSE